MNASATLFPNTFGCIFLIGFMGSGKTHWGMRWAEFYQLTFIDLDEQIEREEKTTISRIFEVEGEDYFRKLEANALRRCASLRNTIVACGGGTPCFLDNMKWMNEHGTTIYFDATPAEIFSRVLSEQAKRPLIKKLSRSALPLFIEQKLEEREPVYRQAKLTVQSGMLTKNSLPEILSTIIS